MAAEVVSSPRWHVLSSDGHGDAAWNQRGNLYRELPDEVENPFDMPILYRDDDIVVVDKPHFLATMPRGGHVAQTALVRLRRELDLPELARRTGWTG